MVLTNSSSRSRNKNRYIASTQLGGGPIKMGLPYQIGRISSNLIEFKLRTYYKNNEIDLPIIKSVIVYNYDTILLNVLRKLTAFIILNDNTIINISETIEETSNQYVNSYIQNFPNNTSINNMSQLNPLKKDIKDMKFGYSLLYIHTTDNNLNIYYHNDYNIGGFTINDLTVDPSLTSEELIEQLNYLIIPITFYSIYNNSTNFSNINKVFFYSSLYYHDSLFAIKTDGSLISHGSIINGAGSIIALKISNFPTINFTLYQNNELEINNLIDMVSINNYSGILLSNIGLRSDGKVVIWGYYITNIIDTNTDFFNNNSHITTVNNNTVGNYIEVKNYLIPDNSIVLIDSDYYNMKHNLTEIIKIYSNNENIFIALKNNGKIIMFSQSNTISTTINSLIYYDLTNQTPLTIDNTTSTINEIDDLKEIYILGSNNFIGLTNENNCVFWGPSTFIDTIVGLSNKERLSNINKIILYENSQYNTIQFTALRNDSTIFFYSENSTTDIWLEWNDVIDAYANEFSYSFLRANNKVSNIGSSFSGGLMTSSIINDTYIDEPLLDIKKIVSYPFGFAYLKTDNTCFYWDTQSGTILYLSEVLHDIHATDNGFLVIYNDQRTYNYYTPYIAL